MHPLQSYYQSKVIREDRLREAENARAARWQYEGREPPRRRTTRRATRRRYATYQV